MKMEEAINRLSDEVSSLQSLLDKPEPGLMTWWSFVEERVSNIIAVYYNERTRRVVEEMNRE